MTLARLHSLHMRKEASEPRGFAYTQPMILDPGFSQFLKPKIPQVARALTEGVNVEA